MILTSLGIVVIILGMIIFVKLAYVFRGIICFAVGITLVLLGTLMPIHGFEKPVLSAKYELKPVLEGSSIYVVQDGADNITYNCAKNTKNSNSKSETKIYIHESEYEIAVINENDKPFCKEYFCKAKSSLFAFAWASDITQLEFCVPETGIAKWNNIEIDEYSETN